MQRRGRRACLLQTFAPCNLASSLHCRRREQVGFCMGAMSSQMSCVRARQKLWSYDCIRHVCLRKAVRACRSSPLSPLPHTLCSQSPVERISHRVSCADLGLVSGGSRRDLRAACRKPICVFAMCLWPLCAPICPHEYRMRLTEGCFLLQFAGLSETYLFADWESLGYLIALVVFQTVLLRF